MSNVNPLQILGLLLRERTPGAGVTFFQNARSTFIGFGAAEEFKIQGGRLKVNTHGDVIEVPGDPLKALSECLSRAAHPAAGFIGYDAVRFSEPILRKNSGSFSLAENDSSFVDALLTVYENYMTLNHADNSLTVHGEAMKSLVERAMSPDNQTRQSESSQIQTERELPIEEMKSPMNREEFMSRVKIIKEHISQGDIFQAVLSTRFETKINADPFRIFETLLKQSPSEYHFYVETGTPDDARVYIGASPEMLLTVSAGGGLETHPIAGTRPRGKDQQEERKMEKQLAASPKENAEHLMLVDLARNDLGRISVPGSVKVAEQASIKKFPSVMHLVSRVTGKLKNGISSLEALMSCFPAGTLSGAPKIRAMQILSEMENLPRGFYGGAVCLFGARGETLDSCIAIRCMEIRGGRAFVQAGAGIVADSRPEFEFQEVVHKTRSVRRALGSS